MSGPGGLDEWAETIESSLTLGPRATEPLDETAPHAGGEELRGQPPVYRALREINRGGMGAILRGVDPATGREVAIKVLHAGPQAGDEARRKFRLEAQVTAQLEHPNIVPVHELSSDDGGALYYSMKLVRGQSLADILAAQRDGDAEALSRWPLPRLLEVFAKICDAMAFAHDRGVLHRDLKPDNAMVGEFGEVLVMDWGLAKVAGGEVGDGSSSLDLAALDATNAQRTQDGAIMGTPAYMPPEQAQGDVARIDARADVYSLGAMLYELLTLERPFTGDTLFAVIAAVCQGELVPPRERAPRRSIPHELEAITLRAMAFDPDDRYASVGDLRDDLDRYREGRLVAVAEYGLGERLWKAVKRHALLTGVSAAAMLAMTAGGLGMRWYQARQATERAAQQRAARAALLSRVDAWRAARDAQIADATTAAALDRVEALCRPGPIRALLLAAARRRAPDAHPAERARWAGDALERIGLTALRARVARRRGDLLEAAGQPDRAFAARAQAYRLDPTDTDGLTAALALGRHYLTRQREALARRVFATVLAHGGPDLRPAALEGLGQAVLAQGAIADAAACFAAAPMPTPRGRAAAELVAHLRGTVAIGEERLLQTLDLDGRPGDEVVTRAGKRLIARRWTGRTFERVLELDVGTAHTVLLGNVAGDAGPEIVRLERMTRGGPRMRLSVAPLRAPGRPLARIDNVVGRLALVDADGDGRKEILLMGAKGRLRTSIVSARDWVVRPLKEIRSMANGADAIEIGGERRLLIGASEWSDFAIHTYRYADGVARALATQRIGALRKLRTCELVPGEPLVCAIIHSGVTLRVGWLLGDGLERSLPGGVWLLRPDGLALRPLLRLDAYASIDNSRDQQLPPPFAAGSRRWLALRGTRADATTHFVTLVRRGETLEPLLVSCGGISAAGAADLDGDGDGEVLAMRDDRLVVLGLPNTPRTSGAIPQPVAPRRTGDARLDRAAELLSLELVDEARAVLEQALAAEGPARNWIAERAALRLIDMDIEARDPASALTRIEHVVRTLPGAAVRATWRAVSLHDRAGDLARLRESADWLAARPTELGVFDRERLARLTSRLDRMSGWRVAARFPGEGWSASEPVQTRTASDVLDLRAGRNPLLVGRRVFVDGVWRLRCRIRVRQLALGVSVHVGLFPLDEAQRDRVLVLNTVGAEWSKVVQVLGAGSDKLSEGLLEQGVLELELRADPDVSELRARGTLHVPGAPPRPVFDQHSRRYPASRGWCQVGLHLRQRVKGGAQGHVQLQELIFERPPLRGRDRTRVPVSLPEPTAAATRAAALLADLHSGAVRRVGETPAFEALADRYPMLIASARKALIEAMAIDSPRLSKRYAESVRVGRFGSALLAVDGLLARGHGAAQLRTVRAELLLRVGCSERVLAELDDAEGEPWVPAWYRGRALIELARYAEAERVLAAALERARAESRGPGRPRVLEQLGYELARARWKRRAREGRVPRASLEGYKLQEALIRR